MLQSLRAWSSSLQSVVTEKRFYGTAGVSQLRADTSGKFKLEKSIRGVLQIHAITVPPGLFAPRQVVDINVFHSNHFEEAFFAMRAAPAAPATPAMRRFRNAEIADGVVDHFFSGARFRRHGHSSTLVLCPDARRKRKR